MSYPGYLKDLLQKLNFNSSIVNEQERELDPSNLDLLANGTSNYILSLQKDNKSLFEIKSERIWKYKVWMKEAELLGP